MFELSHAAGAKLHQSLAGTPMPDNEGKCFRVVPKNDKRLTLRLARPEPSDSTFEHDGAVVLAVPKAIRPLIKDKSLGVDQGGKLELI